MKRLFFALWPDPETRAKCVAVSAALKPAGRPVQPDNLHVTLVFLGSVDEETETKLIEAAEKIAFAKISVRFDSLDYWRRPRIICLSGKPENPSVNLLVEQLNTLAAALEIPTDDRPYQAHVTLIRKASKLRSLTFEPIVWQSDSFCLVESCSTPEGVAYRVLKTWRISEPQQSAEAEPKTLPGLTNPNGAIIIADTSSTHRH